MYAKIWSDINELATDIADRASVTTITSGGFDPLHIGHIRLILQSSTISERLIVVVNGDGFLMRKKGYCFMPLSERIEMIASIRGVSDVVAFDDGSQFVDNAIRILKPHYFAKGGDRSRPEDISVQEHIACNEVGTLIIYGVGGIDKIQSSSWLTEKAKNAN